MAVTAMTIEALLDEFYNDRAIYCSPRTLVSYQSHMAVFCHYLEGRYHWPMYLLDMVDIPPQDNIYSGFIRWLRETRRIKNVTIRSYCRSVRTFLRYCYDHDYCKDYMKGVRLPRDDSEPKMPLYADEVEKIDACFDRVTVMGRRNYAIVHLMLDCGFRSQEVRHLRLEDLDRNRNLLHIRTSKGEKSRIVLCPDFVFDAIESYTAGRSTGWVFLPLRGDNTSDPLTENAIKLMFSDLKIQSGVKRLHAHLLRHTFATSYLIGGGNLEFLRVFMGHYDYTVTKNYSSLAAQCRMLGADIYRLDPIFFTRGY